MAAVSKPGSSSHSVVSIEELTKDSMIKVPKNCIFPDQQSPISDGTIVAAIPTIDMKQLVTNDLELEKLHLTCKEWGIFQLVNHGVSCSLLYTLKREIEEFCKLPLKEKMRYNVRPGDFEGFGTVVKSQNEKLDWGNRFYVITNPIHRRKTHLLPELPSSLRDTLETYFLELQRIAMTLTRFLGKLLRMNMEEMEELFENGLQSMRMTHYPPCPEPELVLGLRPHSDASGITILHQVNGVQGLQIKRDGVWFPVNLDLDAFVVNVGDILEVLSDGLYKSIEHRVTVNSEKARISLAMFFNPKLEAEIAPVTTLSKSPSFKQVRMEKFVEEFFSHGLDGKSHVERLRIENSEGNTTA